jgi:excisionase family DNA binding protein
MPSDVFSELVAVAVSEAQRPLVEVLEELRGEVARTRLELQELRGQSYDAAHRELEVVYLSLQQVAQRLGVSTRTVRRWLRLGKLPHVRLPSGSVRVSVADLEQALAQGVLNGSEADARH